VRLGLIRGHATNRNAALLADIFNQSDWLPFGPEWLRERLDRMSAGSYENSTAAVVSKLLLRKAHPVSTGGMESGDPSITALFT
jgi:hypothetical protein